MFCCYYFDSFWFVFGYNVYDCFGIWLLLVWAWGVLNFECGCFLVCDYFIAYFMIIGLSGGIANLLFCYRLFSNVDLICPWLVGIVVYFLFVVWWVTFTCDYLWSLIVMLILIASLLFWFVFYISLCCFLGFDFVVVVMFCNCLIVLSFLFDVSCWVFSLICWFD